MGWLRRSVAWKTNHARYCLCRKRKERGMIISSHGRFDSGQDFVVLTFTCWFIITHSPTSAGCGGGTPSVSTFTTITADGDNVRSLGWKSKEASAGTYLYWEPMKPQL